MASNIAVQATREEIVEALAKAHPLPVQHACRVCVNYRPLPDHMPPHLSYTTPLHIDDFIHFKKPYNSDWWIGRVVGPDPGMTFVPSERKLMEVRKYNGLECVEVYQQAPIMRPLVLLGPTGKDSELTRLLHKPLLNYLNKKFKDRLHTIKPLLGIRDMSDKDKRVLESEVFAAASTLNLILLDTDASFPGDFEGTKLHPLIIYIKIARQKILRRLIGQLTHSSRECDTQLEEARSVFEQSNKCSRVIADSNVDDACLSLELFVQTYWAGTRSVGLVG